MPHSDPEELVTIGEFAHRARLTPKALRVYERSGLLRPVQIDQATGYRRYSADQLATGLLIGLLRGADLSLAEIKLVLADLTVGAEAAVQRFESLLSNLDRRHATARC